MVKRSQCNTAVNQKGVLKFKARANGEGDTLTYLMERENNKDMNVLGEGKVAT